MHNRCEIPRCRAEADLSYLGHGVCSPHWNQLMNENAPADALRMALGLPAAHEPEVEDTMSRKKTEAKTEMNSDGKTAEPVETNPVASPEKKAKAAKATKPEKPTKAKREPKVKEEGLVVFAFRLTPEERDAIHKAAGPARASSTSTRTVSGRCYGSAAISAHR